MVVFDASAAILGLLNDGDARRSLATETVAIPHLADSDVVQTLRSQSQRGTIAAADEAAALEGWSGLGLLRFEVVGLLRRIWELRNNLSAYHGTYVALAEALDCNLVTADSRLASAPGPTCTVVVVRA